MLRTNGRYWVDVGPQGQILVKPGDWLSKYSAAIHNDFFHIKEYARKDPKSGSPIPIKDKDLNLIIAGWTLFHLPTYYEFEGVTVTVPPPVSDADKKKMTEDALKIEFGLKGDNMPLLSRAIDIVGHVESAAGLAEIAGMIAEGSVAAGAGTALTWGGIVLFPVGASVGWANALEFGFRVTGLRAVAYGTTAWAFDDPMPPVPETIQKNLEGSGKDAWTLAKNEEAWNQARDNVVRELESEVKKNGWQKENYQTLIRVIAEEDDRKKVARELMSGMSPSLRTEFEVRSFWDPAPNYPL